MRKRYGVRKFSGIQDENDTAFSVSHWLLAWRKQQATTNETKFINLDHLGMDHYLISKQ